MPAYVHEATRRRPLTSGDRAPGAAVTVALCGHWQHEGRCRWRDHTAVAGDGERVMVRAVFVALGHEEQHVRERIAGAPNASSRVTCPPEPAVAGR